MKKPILYLLALLLFIQFSCKVHKEITKTEYIVDSTSIRERDSVIRVKRLDSAAYVNTLRILQESGVVFENDIVPPGSIYRDTMYPVNWLANSIEFYPDGTLKKAEGRIKSAMSKADKSQNEAKYWKQAYDSLYKVKSKDSIRVEKESKTVDKYIKKTVFPWYFWLLLLPALLVGYYIKHKSK